jgi:Phosphoglucose isomerase
MPTIPLRDRPAWQALQRHHAQIEGRHLRELFADDPGRGERMCAQAAGLYLDYSKNRIIDETLRLLVRLARESEVEQRRDMMFSGEPINTSEHRSVLHVALRMPTGGVDCTSTACSPRGRFGASTPSTSGGLSWASSSPSRSSPSSSARPNRGSPTTRRRTR